MKNINQKEIVDLIQTRLPLFFGDQKERFQVEFHTMRKENVEYEAVSVTLSGHGFGIQIPVEVIKTCLKRENNLDSLLQDVAAQLRAVCRQMPKTDQLSSLLTSYEAMRERVFIRLRDLSLCEPLRQHGVYTPVCGPLVATYRVKIGHVAGSLQSADIAPEMLETLDISKETLHAQALKNLQAERPLLVKIGNALKERNNLLVSKKPLKRHRLYILTLDSYLNGARVLLRDDVLAQIGEQFGSDFYIFPSSIHEVLIYAKTGQENERGMLQTIAASNANPLTVDPRDVLSNDLFVYERDKKKVTCIASDYTSEDFEPVLFEIGDKESDEKIAIGSVQMLQEKDSDLLH